MSGIKFNLSYFDGWWIWRLLAHIFIANVNVNSDGLNVNVNRFSNDNVWNAENRNRFVIPKLTFSPTFFYGMGVFCFSKTFSCSPFLQPPSILPISSKFFEISAYFSVRISFDSHASCMKNFRLSNFAIVLESMRTFCSVLSKTVFDSGVQWLLGQVIDSFQSTEVGKGLPLGNLTSQLLVNVYMNEFDQWMKHRLKAKYYIRYADDFVIMSENKAELEDVLVQIRFFLQDNLKLDLHPNKVSITTLASGVDFLGWVHFPHHRVLRTVTKRRMFKNLKSNPSKETVQSYLGMLEHGNTWKLREKIQSH